MAKWWLISWTTYATWLPGDKRGYRTWRGRQHISPPKRYAKPGEAPYQPIEHVAVRELAESIIDEPVFLNREQTQIALDAMAAEITEIDIVPVIMSVGDWHVHWLCYFGPLEIRRIVERVKAAATRELNRRGFHGKRPWTKDCNMRSKSSRRDCRNAYKYVRDHRDQGCLIYEWPIDPTYLAFDN